MRRTVLVLAGVLLATVALGSDLPKEYDGSTETDGIGRTLRLTDAECNGQKMDFFECVLTCRVGTYTANHKDGDTLRGSYRIDTTRKPPHLDWMPSNGVYVGQTRKFICQIDGNTLRIASMASLGDLRRPQGFNDRDVLVETYKRVK
jgi:uncharacterized protein (TIGR03067 family)